MTTDLERMLRTLDPATVTHIVRRITRRETLVVRDWQAVRIGYAALNPVTAGLYRLSGAGEDDEGSVSWSVVVKVLRSAGAGTTDPTDLNYWQREVFAYRSGLLERSDAGLVAPRCGGTLEGPGDSISVWLESVIDMVNGPWPRSLYEQAARHLGRWGGTWAAQPSLPSYPWLSRGLLAATIQARGSSALGLIRQPSTWADPRVRRVFPQPLRDRLLRLWADRSALLAALARIPQALCHFDASRHNLFIRHHANGPNETVAIDWASIGVGPVGADLSLLVPSPFFRCEADAAELPEHAEALFAAYTDGMRGAGWSGDTRVIRFGYAASTALRTAFIAPSLAALLDDKLGAAEADRWGHPLPSIMEHRAILTRFLLDLADEARDLLPST